MLDSSVPELIYPESDLESPMDVDTPELQSEVTSNVVTTDVPDAFAAVTTSSTSSDTADTALEEIVSESDVRPSVFTETIPANSFYASASTSVKPPERPASSASVSLESEQPESEGIVSDSLRTYIFTFDSLGSRHPAAVSNLSAYLQLEAKDKKGLDSPSEPVGKQAIVPFQPNYCDCGIYVLHFVQVFMTDPVRYMNLILTKKARGYDSKERDSDWNHAAVGGIRQGLQDRIVELASEWEIIQKQKSEEKKQAAGSRSTSAAAPGEDSDSDVVVEDGPIKPAAPAKPSQAKGKGKARAVEVKDSPVQETSRALRPRG